MSCSKTLANFETDESVSYSIGELPDNLLYIFQHDVWMELFSHRSGPDAEEGFTTPVHVVESARK